MDERGHVWKEHKTSETLKIVRARACECKVCMCVCVFLKLVVCVRAFVKLGGVGMVECKISKFIPRWRCHLLAQVVHTQGRRDLLLFALLY